MFDCKWLAAGGVEFSKIEPSRFEQSNFDSRFKTVVAGDPALAQAYDTTSIEEIAIPVKILSIGTNDQVPAAVNACGTMHHFSNASLAIVAQATHFSFLGECAKSGEAMIYLKVTIPSAQTRGTAHAQT